MDKFYDLFFSKKDEILSAVIPAVADEDIDMFFDASARDFAHFVFNMRLMNMPPSGEQIFAFFASVMLQKLSITSCNPKMLIGTCVDLASELSNL